ncbi:hypothetical protein [Aneurinibacillus danicus]|uniref:Uncharacterized protein n=1 Tax=Aneurinibacillus danicus TaxID=267746 RepID=A0A511VCI6_9BACL|nr:hypothetical protein [Aneurinibacillus danicus]GEN36605.1 hypothetical protein ADA01nite_40650 [Aneurinibacillus danicus]
MSITLLQIETMSAAEKLGEAFLAHGFLVKVQGDRLIFSPGNGLEDMNVVRKILERAGVPALYNGWEIQILVPHIPNHLALSIMKKPKRRANYYIPYGYHGWRGFTKRNHGLRFNTLNFDPGIALLLKAMSEAGILVTGGCDGHEQKAPRIYFASRWAMAWFEILRERFMQRLDLHYKWEVDILTSGSPSLYALKAEDEGWELKKIQHDTVQMALILHKHAVSLRQVRRDTFKFKSMYLDAKNLENNYHALYSWMKEILKQRLEKL